MSIFDDVRQLNLIDVARQYGLSEHGNMVNCIFHNDRTPSMKLYPEHFHCIGCGAHGDVTDLTAQLFGLSKYEAAQELCSDFGITQNASSPKIMPRIKIISQREKENQAINTLIAYSKMLRENAKRYAPKSDDEELHPLFVENLQQQIMYEYYLDVLMETSSDERAEFIKTNKEVIDYADRELTAEETVATENSLPSEYEETQEKIASKARSLANGFTQKRKIQMCCYPCAVRVERNCYYDRFGKDRERNL